MVTRRDSTDLFQRICHELKNHVFNMRSRLDDFTRNQRRDQRDGLESLSRDLAHFDKFLRSAFEALCDTADGKPSSGPRAPLAILWVDNDLGQIAGFARAIRDTGWAVSTVDSVAAALKLIRKRSFDIALLDVMMPFDPLTAEETRGGLLTGLALARQIRKQQAGIAIGFVTIATRNYELAAWCTHNPPARVIPKLIHPRQLIDGIDALVRRSNLEVEHVLLVLRKFSIAVRALSSRYSSRATLTIEDEYDVQDILKLILMLEFSDVRAEEWSPSYAGGASRIDFVLPVQQVAIEVKMTRRGLTQKQLGEQLLVDIVRYRSHPAVSSLICVIIDRLGLIRNPHGFAEDLRSAAPAGFETHTLIFGSDVLVSGPPDILA